MDPSSPLVDDMDVSAADEDVEETERPILYLESGKLLQSVIRTNTD